MSHVDLLFLCTQHSVSERGLRDMFDALNEIGDARCSVQRLAEKISFSVEQTKRMDKALSWHDDERNIPPIIQKYDGKRGIPYRRKIIKDRAAQLGLCDYAA